MSAFITAIALAMVVGVADQDPTLENKAVIRVQQTLVSQYDPALPARPFGSWFNQIVGPQSGVSWSLTECVQQTGAVSEGEQVIPACVQATAILPNERKVVAQILVGSFRFGLSPTTKFHFAVVEANNQFRNARRLRDLSQLLWAPFPQTRLRVVALPSVRAIKPQLYIVKSPALIAPPKIISDGTGAETSPPPKTDSLLRVSHGVTFGEVVTKVMPIYPSLAKQISASGEVQVGITIDETGQVIEAKAISGHPTLRIAAEDAARKWVFKPTLLDGKPVKQEGVLTFVFARPQ